MFEPTEWINVTGVDNMLGSIVLDDGLVTVVVDVVVYGTTVKTCVVIAQKRIEKWMSYAYDILMQKSE
jgi:hypothetical protein